MSDSSSDKNKDAGKKDSISSDQTSDSTQKAFDAWAKLSGSNDAKMKNDAIQQWIKKAGISGVSDDDVKKHFGIDDGVNFDEFKQSVEELAKDKQQDMEAILEKLATAFPAGVTTAKIDDTTVFLAEEENK